jgi:hypothetical protein
MGRNNKDFNHGIQSVAVPHPNNPNDILINRFPKLKDPKDWVPHTLEREAKENALNAERDEVIFEDV